MVNNLAVGSGSHNVPPHILGDGLSNSVHVPHSPMGKVKITAVLKFPANRLHAFLGDREGNGLSRSVVHRRPITLGEIWRDEFLEPLGLSQKELAEAGP